MNRAATTAAVPSAVDPGCEAVSDGNPSAPVPAELSRRGPRTGSVAWLLTGLVRLYQLVVSPWLGPSCRFEPSCSAYALEALSLHGAIRGSWLVLRRLARCQPFCSGGYDPVPELRRLRPRWTDSEHSPVSVSRPSPVSRSTSSTVAQSAVLGRDPRVESSEVGGPAGQTVLAGAPDRGASPC